MNRILSIAALVATLGVAPLAATAQNAPAPTTGPTSTAPAPSDAATPHARRMGRLARALGELDLTPDQRARARSAMQAYRASRSTATPETRAQLRANLETILTPDQRAQFETKMRRPAPAPVATPA